MIHYILLHDYLKKRNSAAPHPAPPVIIYGAGHQGRRLLKKLLAAGLPVSFFCDRNESLENQTIDGVKVLSPARLEDLQTPFDLFLSITNPAFPVANVLAFLEGFSLPCTYYRMIPKELRQQERERALMLKQLQTQRPDLFQLLQSNAQFKDIHLGERCFVLGSGPTLDNLDFDDIKDEYVFTTSFLVEHPQYELLKNSFHIWICHDNWEEPEQAREGSPAYNPYIDPVVRKKYPPVTFMDLDGYGYMKRHGYDKKLDLHFIKPRGLICEEFYGPIDFTSFVPECPSSSQMGILLALYMGFKEIYLHGFNADLLAHYFVDYLGAKKIPFHFGSGFTQADPMCGASLEWIYYHQSQELKFFRVINDYCRMHQVKLINLSPQTFIQSIPRMDFSELWPLAEQGFSTQRKILSR